VTHRAEPEPGMETGSDRPRRRLESWKEIAAYLGRDVRTAQRWERREQLPVHRLQHSKRGSVYAYPVELDAWRESRDSAPGAAGSVSQSNPLVDQRAAVLVGLTAVCVLALAFTLRPQPAERADASALRAVSPQVYENYLKGLLHFERGDRTHVEESISYLEATVVADPTFSPAYVQLAAAYQALGQTGTGARPVAEVQPKAALLARKALELNPGLAAAHSSLASVYQQEWRWEEAEAGYRRALEIDPNDATTHARIAALLVWSSRADEGLAHARRARELDPLNVERTIHLGWLLYHARLYDEALRELRIVLAAQPDHRRALWFLAFVLIDSSRLEEAIQSLERLVGLWDRNPAALGLLARAYGNAGRRAEAVAIVEALKRDERAGYVPPAPFVHAYVGLGDRENAFASLDRAFRERSNIVQFVQTHPLYDSLRGDSRFAQLVRRVGLD
jgi:tetratricopeptide (TPR) repeat protein